MRQNKLDERKKESFKLFDQIAGTYDLLNHTLSLGIDIIWRNQLASKLKDKKYNDILDLATGTGDVAVTLAKKNIGEKIIAMDLSEGMMDVGRKKIKTKSVDHIIEFRNGDGCNIPLPDASVDAVTISFGIRNFPDFRKGLQEVHRVLKPGGKAVIMEFGIPYFPPLKLLYLFYFRFVLPFFGNIVSKHKDAYTYLNKTVEDFPFAEKFTNEMRNVGLTDTNFQGQTGGISYLYTGVKK